MLSDVDLAYIAGFFDGEGSITIHQNWRPSPRGKSPNHTLQVSIGNTDPSILIWLHANFGGSLVSRQSRPRHRDVTQWTVRAASALPFLVAIRPFLRMKKRQADVAIEYQKTKSMRGPIRVTPEDIQWREAQRETLRQLNGRNCHLTARQSMAGASA